MPASYALVTHADGWRTVEPKPSPAALKAFYAQEYFQASHGIYAQAYSETERTHRALIARLLLFAAGKGRRGAGGRLLEVGCGEGWLLAAAQDAGFDVRGLDFSDDGLKRLHPALLPKATFGDVFESLDGLIADGAQFEVVAMEHVLEHVLDPERLLETLPRVIAPGGVVAITVPNDFSPAQQALRAAGQIDRDFWVAPPQHLNYFDAPSLGRLLARSSFEVAIGYASFPIDWFLFHGGSNYVADPAQGKPAHQARMAIDLMLAEQGIDAYLGLAEALYRCGAGRSLTVIARPRS
ncbi:MAG TPA: class I SAM-dependent methyltransferase [Caulobacteraceae bacterium]|jgi:2-polyprenyl-3-methyl-5-hydroxy-6-metoxy-1,4-benzoquinol methylase